MNNLSSINQTWILIDGIITSFTTFTTREIIFSPSLWSGPYNIWFNTNNVASCFNFEKTQLAPIFAPRISNNPIFLLSGFIKSPSYYADCMIELFVSRFVVINATFISDHRFSVNCSSYRASPINFRFDSINITMSSTILTDRDSWVLINSYTLPTLIGKSVTCSTLVNRCALKIFGPLFTVSFLWFCWTWFVSQTGVEGNSTWFFNPSIGGQCITSVARSCLTTTI